MQSRQQRRHEARKGARVPGFEGVPSRRVNGLYQAGLLLAMSRGVDALEAQSFAWRHVASQLPPPPMIHRAIPLSGWRPSRSDNPEYRKN